MIKKLILLLIVIFNLNYIANAEQKDFFNDAKELYEKESYDDSNKSSKHSRSGNHKKLNEAA